MVLKKLEEQIAEISQEIEKERKSLEEQLNRITSEKKSLQKQRDSLRTLAGNYETLKENTTRNYMEEFYSRNPDILIDCIYNVTAADLFISIGRFVFKRAEELYLASFTSSDKTKYALWTEKPEIFGYESVMDENASFYVAGMKTRHQIDEAICHNIMEKLVCPKSEKYYNSNEDIGDYIARVYKLK